MTRSVRLVNVAHSRHPEDICVDDASEKYCPYCGQYICDPELHSLPDITELFPLLDDDEPYENYLDVTDALTPAKAKHPRFASGSKKDAREFRRWQDWYYRKTQRDKRRQRMLDARTVKRSLCAD